VNPKDAIGSRKAPLGLIPATLLPFVAPAMAVGAAKYGPMNWREQPVQAMIYAEAAMRHLLAWVDGQNEAEDTDVNHIAHALAGLAILADAIASDNLIDNRPPAGATADLLRAQDRSLTVVPAPVYEAPNTDADPQPAKDPEHEGEHIAAQYLVNCPRCDWLMKQDPWAFAPDHHGEDGVTWQERCNVCGVAFGEHVLDCSNYH
jgi:hypothetical protein